MIAHWRIVSFAGDPMTGEAGLTCRHPGDRFQPPSRSISRGYQHSLTCAAPVPRSIPAVHPTDLPHRVAESRGGPEHSTRLPQPASQSSPSLPPSCPSPGRRIFSQHRVPAGENLQAFPPPRIQDPKCGCPPTAGLKRRVLFSANWIRGRHSASAQRERIRCRRRSRALPRQLP